MKTTEDFINDETRIIAKFCDALKECGYEAKWFYNQLGDPTVYVDLKDEEGHEDRYYACFDVRELV